MIIIVCVNLLEVARGCSLLGCHHFKRSQLWCTSPFEIWHANSPDRQHFSVLTLLLKLDPIWTRQNSTRFLHMIPYLKVRWSSSWYFLRLAKTGPKSVRLWRCGLFPCRLHTSSTCSPCRMSDHRLKLELILCAPRQATCLSWDQKFWLGCPIIHTSISC